MTEAPDLITLRGLSAVGHHGVHDFERNGAQVFSADLNLHVDSRLAAKTDDMSHTVDYSAIADDAVKILTGKPVYLLETLAHNLAEMALRNPLVASVEVTIHKPMAPVRHQFTDVSVTIKRDRERVKLEPEAAPAPASTRVVLALGSNQGDSKATLTQAVGALMEIRGFEIDDVSPLVITRPVLAPGQTSQPDYFNAVVIARTILTPTELLSAAQSIENQFGRDRTKVWGERTLDIDLIDYGHQSLSTPELRLPHPRAHNRAFVLYPWSLIAADDVFADGRRIADLAAAASDRLGILDTLTDWLDDGVEEPMTAAPEVLVVPPPPMRPSGEAGRPEVRKPLAAPTKRSSESVSALRVTERTPNTDTVSIRGNRVALEPSSGDLVFQKLLHTEEVKSAPARPAPQWPPRASVQLADRAPKRGLRAATSPPEKVMPEAPRVFSPPVSMPPATAPSFAPLSPTSSTPGPAPKPASPPPPQRPRVHGFGHTVDGAQENESPRLPDWKSVSSARTVRVVDAVEVTDVSEEPSVDEPPPNSTGIWRKVVHPKDDR